METNIGNLGQSSIDKGRVSKYIVDNINLGIRNKRFLEARKETRSALLTFSLLSVSSIANDSESRTDIKGIFRVDIYYRAGGSLFFKDHKRKLAQIEDKNGKPEVKITKNRDGSTTGAINVQKRIEELVLDLKKKEPQSDIELLWQEAGLRRVIALIRR